MFKKDTAVPLVTLDNETLLKAEKESRKTHKKAIAGVYGSTARLIYSPMAAYGIAKSGLKGHNSFWSHQDLLAEIHRRKLTPLPLSVDEHMGVLVAGQVVSFAAGSMIGEMLEPVSDVAVSSVIGAGDSLGVGDHVAKFVSGKVAETIAEGTVDGVIVGAADHVASGAVGGDGVEEKDKGKVPHQRKPVLGFIRKPHTGPAVVTSHLSGRWDGFAQEEEEVKSGEEGDRVGDGGEEVDADLGSAATAVLQVVSDVQKRLSWGGTKPDDANGTKTSPAKHQQPVLLPGQKLVTIVARYRLKMDLVFLGVKVQGKNWVDEDSSIEGIANEQGTLVTLTERNSNITVHYQGKVSGGQIIGRWKASDGREGAFKLTHL
ncbi:hypothetical protein HDU76_000605 [Blyttiomyces sp. JEL0837]|nr:hypothetical protein HDU76_000605 [Blyttiomyces sp. JEL0837]